MDTLPLSFEDRWTGDPTTGAAVNASSYSTFQKLITRILIQFTVQSSNRDRVKNEYQSITLQEDIDVRRIGY
jgi:hypothetical protein